MADERGCRELFAAGQDRTSIASQARTVGRDSGSRVAATWPRVSARLPARRCRARARRRYTKNASPLLAKHRLIQPHVRGSRAVHIHRTRAETKPRRRRAADKSRYRDDKNADRRVRLRLRASRAYLQPRDAIEYPNEICSRKKVRHPRKVHRLHLRSTNARVATRFRSRVLPSSAQNAALPPRAPCAGNYSE